MKMRMVSLLLALVMIIGLCPVTANAGSTDMITVGGVQMTDGTFLAVGADSTTVVQPEGGYAYYADNVLTLCNYTYTGTLNQRLIEATCSALTILLEGENRLEASGEQGCSVYVGADRLTFEEGAASGKLILCGGGRGIDFRGSVKDGYNLVFNSGTFLISDTSHAVVSSCDTLIQAAGFQTEAVGKGLSALGSMLVINGGEHRINSTDAGVYGTRITVNDGNLVLRSVNGCIETGSSFAYINGGCLDAMASKGTVLVNSTSMMIDDRLEALASVRCNDALGAYAASDSKTYQHVVILPEYTVDGLQGDVNGDGKIDLSDATRLFYYLNGLVTLEGKQWITADVNDTNDIDLNDVAWLFYFANDLIS